MKKLFTGIALFAAATTVAAQDDDKHGFYVAFDMVEADVQLSRSAAIAAGDYVTDFYKYTVGYDLNDEIGLEVQFGSDNSDDGPDSLELDSYFGVFLQPRTTMFTYVDLAFPIGYAQTDVIDAAGNVEEIHNAVAGINAGLALRSFGENLPDLRIYAGGMMYGFKDENRMYGFHFGARFNFKI